MTTIKTENTRSRKLRKELGFFGALKDYRVSTDLLVSELSEQGLFLKAKWTAASMEADNPENLFIKANSACKMNFNKGDEKAYQEINLSVPNFKSLELSKGDQEREGSMTYRMKRLDPNRKEFSEHASETSHFLDPKYNVGELARLLEQFKGRTYRVRLASMAPNSEIRPHVDYDPSYVFRYHVVLRTHPDVFFGAHARNNTSFVHMPGTGRVYWLNTGVVHSVVNSSSVERIHLLIDVDGSEEQENIPNLRFFNTQDELDALDA